MRGVEKFFSKCTKKCVLGLGIILGIILWYTGWWDAAEPIFATPAIVMAVYIYLSTEKKKKRVYTAGNEDGDWVVVLQVGRPVVEAVKKATTKHIDVLLDTETILGDATLYTDEQYKTLAREVYKAIEGGQGKRIHFFLSGPLGLSNMIGQMTPPHMFDMVVYHYDITTKGYAPLPRPDRSWFA